VAVVPVLVYAVIAVLLHVVIAVPVPAPVALIPVVLAVAAGRPDIAARAITATGLVVALGLLPVLMLPVLMLPVLIRIIGVLVIAAVQVAIDIVLAIGIISRRAASMG